MFCHNCGSPVPDGSKFCENCGTNLGTSSFTPPKMEMKPNPFAEKPYVANATASPNPFGEPETENSSTSVVKWIVLGIIAIIVLGFVFDMVVLSKANSDFNNAVKESNRQYDRAMRDYDRHMNNLNSQINSIRW